jgi:hypothetical protein
MPEKFYKKSFATIHREVHEQLKGRDQGHTLSLVVGDGLFPGSLPPRLEIILLDPEDMTVAFRKITDAQGKTRKKGEWHIGPTASAAEKIVAWVEQMISLKAAHGAYEVEEI